MLRNGWRPLASEDPPPRHFEPGDVGWFRYPMVSQHLGTAIGAVKLRKLRASSARERLPAAEDFAGKVAELLPPGAWVTFMPSSTRPSADSNRDSIPHLVLARLRQARQDLSIVEPLIRRAPVPSVHESRTHDIALLRSTLEPAPTQLACDELFVIDDMIGTGATFAAFRAALLAHWPRVRPILAALVYGARRPKLFE